MPQWSNRLLTPSSQSKLGGSEPVYGNSKSPARVQPRKIESESPEGNHQNHHLSQHNTSSSNDTKPSGSANHGRSKSHPFPSIFSGKKKRQGNAPTSTGIEFADDDFVAPISSRDGAKNKTIKQKHSSTDFITGKCMTCDSTVRWPKELNVFRCTVCLAINDLKPTLLETRHQDGYRIPPMKKFGEPTDSRFSHHVPPLSIEKLKKITEDCVKSYLLNRLKKASDSAKSSLLLDSSKNWEEIEQSENTNPPKSNVEPLSLPLPKKISINFDETKKLNLRSLEKSSLDVCQSDPTLLSSSTPGNFFSAHMSLRDRDVDQSSSKKYSSMPDNFSEENPDNSRDKKAHDAKNIFKPLEDYIISAFGSFECINSSFCTVRPIYIPRAASEGLKNAPHPSQFENQTMAETLISEMDAKTLLLGDFAENGSWWTGNRTNLRNSGGTRSRGSATDNIHDGKTLVTLKSPHIDWVRTNEWYHNVLHAGKGWRRSLEILVKSESRFSQVRSLSDYELDEIEDELLDARAHTQRVLLKATETLLKRPSRPLNDPSDLRFLLIILENPLLHPVSSISRGKQRSRSRSRSPNPQTFQKTSTLKTSRQPFRNSSNHVKGDSGKHSGIIKRVLGLLSNVSNECHHHLVSWFSRYSESQFQRITDLIGSFVTYRLLKQHGKKREIEQDPTAGLIPSMPESGRNSSAALHAALGSTGQTSKKVDSQPKIVVYNDDWQIKAAARVMSLLFSANNSGLIRRGEGKLVTGPQCGYKYGMGARQRARNHGQIIETSDFYNSLLDCSDLIADFEAWESRRCKFSFCQYPFFLSIWAKIQIMEYDARRQMEVRAREAFFDSIMTRKTINQYLVLSVRRECLVEDSLKAVSEVVGSGDEEIKKGLRITFKGEEGIDAGGLRKEWFLLLVRDVFNPEHGMFTYDEDSRCCYFNPNSFETTDQFFLVGVVLGLAIYNSTILDVALPSFAFRKLLAAGPPPTPGATSHAKPSMIYSLDDLAQYRPALANGLRKLLEYDGDVENTFCRDFVADVDRYGQITQVPLCPNGERRTVTNENRREFVNLYVRYLLDTAVTRQFEPFKRGFFTVCGGNALSLFRPEEIELLIRGSDENLDIASLRAVCIYENWGGNNPAENEPVVKWFWETFQATKSVDQRRLLSFITGSDRIPAMGATNLVIKLSCLGDDVMRFPVARTCFNQLSLWRYSTKEKLEHMLWRAVYESEGFGLK